MMVSYLQRKLGDISISRKLFFTVGIMAILVTIELCTLAFAVRTLSSVRAFINGEGLWSKAQKDAVYTLLVYAHSHNEKDYQAFRDYLKVSQGDNKTRLELGKANPDLQVARLGFIEGRNSPEDIDGMITLLTRFNKVSYLNRAIHAWGNAQQSMEQLIAMSDELHVMIRSNNVSQQEIDQVLLKAEVLNRKVTLQEDEFSASLGEGSRWMEKIILRLLLTLSFTIASVSILITISVSRGIERGLKAIIDGAALVGTGLLKTRVKVYSRDEIGTLATAFNQMTDMLERKMQNIRELEDTGGNLKKEKEKAEASEKTKQLFLAKMSHEIRTPMNAILGFAKLLEESLTEKEQQEYIRIIIKSGDDLLFILNDILDFSRMEAGKMTFESIPFNLKDIVQTNVLMMKPKAQQKGVALTFSIDEKIPQVIAGDSVRLNQVLLNLISNAIKFTEKGSITISVVCVEENNDNVTLDFGIKDTGMGIPAEKQETIFESFEQASNDTARKFGGSGLGLSIVKQLVKLQGGEISVSSKPGVGSDFHFKLSFLKNSNQPDKISTVNTDPEFHNGKGIRVLLVEDNKLNQLLATKILRKHGFETEVADNGLIALEIFSNNNFDIILMDLQMPEMDGYETTQKIRAMESNKKHVPIIAMTAHTIKGELEHCIEIGMDDFISKPFDPSELYTKLHQLAKKNLNAQIDL